MQSEHLLRKTQADNILERTAMQLQPLLHEACEALRPFPPFPNALFTHAIEIEAPAEATMDYGCIVVCEDGEFYELQMGIDHDAVEMSGSWDPVTARKETLEKIDLHPRDYVAFAYNALGVVTELLLEREQEQQGAKGTGGA
ncbi:MAG: hypothetical protein U5Q44_11725 [Dehalococcoidia bacterium]|nr:hypothetical protein [Dehalococcoidia bacterium]